MAIPKVIHYIWLGGEKMPDLLKRCIDSWHKIMPDYEIKKWDESNIPINDYPFMKESYMAKKYAFTSDMARYMILYQHGGLFFDCDVEVLKPFDPFLKNSVFCALAVYVGNIAKPSPGLVLGSEPKNDVIMDIINIYKGCHFVDQDNGKQNLHLTSPNILYKYTKEKGFRGKDEKIMLNNGLMMYPSSFFDPMRHTSLKENIYISDNTYSIHWCAASWISPIEKYRRVISILLRRIVGDRFVEYIKNFGNGEK